MRATTTISAGLLALSGAAIAQVTTAPEPKLGNAQAAANASAANGSSAPNGPDNANDPGKP